MTKKIDIQNGRYWDEPWSLVDGCTPCSPGCDHCWAAAMTRRFEKTPLLGSPKWPLVNSVGQYNGQITTHPERLSVPMKRRKPTVFAVWNDLFHESVPDDFIERVFAAMEATPRHTYLILTKRPRRMSEFVNYPSGKHLTLDNVWFGLTVCNQEEADEKIPIFLQVPGKKYLSIEPLISPIWLPASALSRMGTGGRATNGSYCPGISTGGIEAVILGGETGPGARPMHPDWVRSVRNQCAEAGVPFFFKGWGEWVPAGMVEDETKFNTCLVDGTIMCRVGRKASGRLLDGRTHNDLPWVTK